MNTFLLNNTNLDDFKYILRLSHSYTAVAICMLPLESCLFTMLFLLVNPDISLETL